MAESDDALKCLEDEEMEVPEIIEEIIEMLLSALRDSVSLNSLLYVNHAMLVDLLATNTYLKTLNELRTIFQVSSGLLCNIFCFSLFSLLPKIIRSGPSKQFTL